MDVNPKPSAQVGSAGARPCLDGWKRSGWKRGGRLGARALVAAVEAHARQINAAVDGARGGAGLVELFGAC